MQCKSEVQACCIIWNTTSMKNNFNTYWQYQVHLFKYIPWQELRRIHWKNTKPPPTEAYKPTQAEHIANVITHGVLIIPSIMAMFELLSRSHNGAQFVSALVYGATLIFLFSVSTCFHCVFYCHNHGQLKDFLHRCDRAMIYIFIAGSYFPWLTIQTPSTIWASFMRWFIWLLAAFGIVYQQAFHEKYKMLETIFYLFMGIFPALPFVTEHDFHGKMELMIGGLVYCIGVIFFKMDGCIPCAHAIWHLFVVMAATVHYCAILFYLFPELPLPKNSYFIKTA